MDRYTLELSEREVVVLGRILGSIPMGEFGLDVAQDIMRLLVQLDGIAKEILAKKKAAQSAERQPEVAGAQVPGM